MENNERIGETSRNKKELGNYEMKIIEYNKYNDIIVEFQDKYKARVHTDYRAFKNGGVKNPYHPSVYNIGYIGIGKYKTKINGKILKVYDEWKGMLRRCYSEEYHKKEPTYISCEVCKEWLCFQNYAKWREDNYYECNNEGMQLDKDILVKGNKIYSPETCIFVPQRINQLFNKSKKNKESNLPIGVFNNPNGSGVGYCACCRTLDSYEYLGLYNTVEEAFEVYKQFKEKYIKQVADEYYRLIPRELWKAMWEYQIDIDD